MDPRSLAAAALCALAAGCHRPEVTPSSPPRPPPPSAPPAAPATVEIVPGVAVGPIRIGMRRDEVERLRVLRPHPRWSGRTVPFHVAYDDGDRVALVEISLLRAPADVRVGEAVLPRGTTFLEARKILGGDCTQPEIGFGGGTFSCRDNRVDVMGGSGSPDEIWIGTHPAR
jgi:hypothetical protein